MVIVIMIMYTMMDNDGWKWITVYGEGNYYYDG